MNIEIKDPAIAALVQQLQDAVDKRGGLLFIGLALDDDPVIRGWGHDQDGMLRDLTQYFAEGVCAARGFEAADDAPQPPPPGFMQ